MSNGMLLIGRQNNEVYKNPGVYCDYDYKDENDDENENDDDFVLRMNDGRANVSGAPGS